MKEQVEEVSKAEEIIEKKENFNLRSQLLKVASDMNLNLPSIPSLINIPEALARSQRDLNNNSLNDSSDNILNTSVDSFDPNDLNFSF